MSSGRGDPAAGELAGDRAPPLQPWQPCATRAWTTRTARTSCPRAGSREPPRTVGFTMPSKGAAGGPPGLGRSWNPAAHLPGTPRCLRMPPARGGPRARAQAWPGRAKWKSWLKSFRGKAAGVLRTGHPPLWPWVQRGSPGGAQTRPLLPSRQRCTVQGWQTGLIPFAPPKMRKKCRCPNPFWGVWVDDLGVCIFNKCPSITMCVYIYMYTYKMANTALL